MAKFITDLGPGCSIDRYAVWYARTNLHKNIVAMGYPVYADFTVIQTSNDLDQLAAKHNLDAGKVIKLYED